MRLLYIFFIPVFTFSSVLNHPTKIDNQRMVNDRLVTHENSFEYSQTHIRQQANYNNEQIKTVQTMLLNKGYKVGNIDGIMGKKTRNSLMTYQADNKLEITGKLDENTLDSLEIYSADEAIYSE